jgi:CRP/FNR family cyclic AMP-dependent transcriptional regulator
MRPRGALATLLAMTSTVARSGTPLVGVPNLVHLQDRLQALAVLGLSPAEARQALAAARGRSYERRQAIFHEGDPDDALHVLLRGRVAITISGPEGCSLTLAILGPGELTGETAVLDRPGVRSVTARALEQTDTLAIAHADLAALRRAHPAVGEALLGLVAFRAERLGARLYEAHFVPAETRVLRRLVELSGPPPPGRRVALLLTQEELGGLAGTARATVNRVLREEAARGTVELGRGRVSVLRWEELSRRAGLPRTGAA